MNLGSPTGKGECECGQWSTEVKGDPGNSKPTRDEIIRRYRKHEDAATALDADRRGGYAL